MRGRQLIRAVRKSGQSFPANDLAEEQLRELETLTQYPSTLDEVRQTSRAAFGWFTKQEARSLEYPWVVEFSGDVAGKRVIDLGAGVSPVPLVLADRGADVTTVDYMPADSRQLDTRDEWGFLDYSTIRSTITSINGDATKVELDRAGYDVVMSISVIEHMPAEVRRRVLARAAEWVRPGGRLVLTIDLQPNSNELWNLDRGETVDPPAQHGTLTDLEDEIVAVGFELVRVEIVRWASDTRRTDLAFLLGIRQTTSMDDQ